MSIAASKKFSNGDTGYTDIWNAWVTNGRPKEFDRFGTWGGAIYRAHNLADTYPDFYQYCSLGPTKFDESGAGSKPMAHGFWLLNRYYMRLKVWMGQDERWKVRRPSIPNDL